VCRSPDRPARDAHGREPPLSEVDDPGPFYHGTKADLRTGDLLEPGRRSNVGAQRTVNHVYLTATLDAAVWGAELAVGDGPGRIYRVEPTGALENDPNLTDTRFPGNPTRSYRTRKPLRVVDEVRDWQGHPPEALAAMRARLVELERLGIEAID
jgi:Rifampin ADP-ribosyl transferase